MSTMYNKIMALPKYPFVKQDLSILIYDRINYVEVEKIVLETNLEILIDIIPFEVYKDESIPQDKKVLGLELTFQKNDATLTKDEIEKAMNIVKNALKEEVGAEIR